MPESSFSHSRGVGNNPVVQNLRILSGVLRPGALGPLRSSVVHRHRESSYQANAFGLHDMHGNVAEWCGVLYDLNNYEDCAVDDPAGPSRDGPAETSSNGNVVARGGSWYRSLESARAAYRQDEIPWIHSGGIGFQRFDRLRGMTSI
jgi:hypothetical protein